MPREQKIGFAILILIVGFAGAFCFRRQPAGDAALPALRNEQQINQQVAELRTRPLLPGVDMQPSAAPAATLPEDRLQQELSTLQPLRPQPLAGHQAPPPISTLNDTYATPLSGQAHNSSRADAGAARTSRTNSQGNSASETASWISQAQEQLTHTVQPGETLTGIAYHYYGSVAKFQQIYEANTDVLSSPNHLRPGMKLRLPPAAGASQPSQPAQPMKEAQRRDTEERPERSSSQAAPTSPEASSAPAVSEPRVPEPRDLPPAAAVKAALETQTGTAPPAGSGSRPEAIIPAAAALPAVSQAPAPSAAPRKKLFVPARHNPFQSTTTLGEYSEDHAPSHSRQR